MSRIATLKISLEVIGANGSFEDGYAPDPIRFATAVLQRQPLSLANGANTITPPTGARFVILNLGTAVSLTIKGLTADQGVSLTPANAPLGIPGLFPLSSVTSFVITNGTTTQSVEAIWL